MTELINSIQILSHFAREAGKRSSLLTDFGFSKKRFDDLTEKDLTLFNSLFYMIVIDSCSYLDEYEQVFGVRTGKENNVRIRDVKTINKPFISKVKEWQQMKELRNQLLSHNLRRGKNSIFLFGIDDLNYDAPRTLNDVFLLSNLIQVSTLTIHNEFQFELNTYTVESRNIKAQPHSLTEEAVKSIMVKLCHLANEEAVKLKKPYGFTIRPIN